MCEKCRAAAAEQQRKAQARQVERFSGGGGAAKGGGAVTRRAGVPVGARAGGPVPQLRDCEDLKAAEQRKAAKEAERQARIRKRVLTVELLVDPADPASADDRFTLRSDDGAYSVVKTIRDDRQPGDNCVTLDFEGLLPGRRYSLQVDPGAQGAAYDVFTQLPYEQIGVTEQ